MLQQQNLKKIKPDKNICTDKTCIGLVPANVFIMILTILSPSKFKNQSSEKSSL
jgi:hypothetical protein